MFTVGGGGGSPSGDPAPPTIQFVQRQVSHPRCALLCSCAAVLKSVPKFNYAQGMGQRLLHAQTFGHPFVLRHIQREVEREFESAAPSPTATLTRPTRPSDEVETDTSANRRLT